jgi:hypothetical protein
LTRISVGGVGSRLFVAYIDNANTLVEAAVIDVDDVPAAERKDGVDALGFERLGDKVATRDDTRVATFRPQRILGRAARLGLGHRPARTWLRSRINRARHAHPPRHDAQMPRCVQRLGDRN